MGLPRISASGLPGNLEEAYLAGMTTHAVCVIGLESINAKAR